MGWVVCRNLTRHVIELHIGNGLHVYEPSYDLRINNLKRLPSLFNLENLNISSVDLSNATTWLQASSNFFNCPLPIWLFDLNNLENLKLSDSGIEGVMPREAGNVTKLRNLDLAYNKLNSTIPKWIYRCKDLESLILFANNIEGVVSNAISNLSSITSIDLSRNMLSGKLPNVIGKLSKLRSLDLSGNLFKGEVFELRNSSSLTELILRNNKLTGTLPESLSQLPMLESIDISNNRLEDVVAESHFTNWTQLRNFFASNNNLTLKVSQKWIPPFQAIHIEIAGWNIGPLFPRWLQTQKNINSVDISNGGIQGEVPTWFWNLSSQIELLDLSHNQFVGVVPTILKESYNWLMLLGSNNFSGPLP
uniref:Probable leucine-rich repeat receptor-like protein kinase At1g35710 n=1 Tax=Nicotiana tabacum TaxID=4097 RepID=A0A1S4CSY9_TOBAC|nr:PREDICTED: probable leucine-rich repeat receptor-like protein kinase At1g35710 [Nicotiana tabacum]